MSLYDGNNVVHLKRPPTRFDFYAKAAGFAAPGNACSDGATVIRFPGTRSAAMRIDRASRHTIRHSPDSLATPLASTDSPTGWPVRVPHGGNPDAPPGATNSEHQSSERSADEGAPLGTE